MSGAYLIGLGGTISMHQTAQGAVPVTGAVELSETVAGFSGAESLALVGGSEVDFDLLERLVARARELVAERGRRHRRDHRHGLHRRGGGLAVLPGELAGAGGGHRLDDPRHPA
mgnify:FL=1